MNGYPLWRASLAGAMLALVSLAASAADKPAPKPREGSLGKGRSSLPILTRNELRACLAHQDKLKAETSDVLSLQRALDDDKADIARRQSTLEAERTALDRTSQPAVDGHNARARDLDQRIDAYNARNASFNTRADALRTQRDAWERDCGDRRYFEDDLMLIRSGR
jgi:hypothetical protein